MKSFGISIAVAAFAALSLGAPACADELRIGGTGNALGVAKKLAEAFGKESPEVHANVLPSLGTSGAIKAVSNRALDIGLSARPLTDAERALGIESTEFARTPLVFAVAKRSAATTITLGQIADFLDGKAPNWPDGSQVRPILRQVGDDNTNQVMQMSPALRTAMGVAEKRPGLPFATTDQEAVEKMEAIPGAFGVTTLGQIISESLGLRALVLDGIVPNAANGASGKYAHLKHLHFITQHEASATAKRFIAFTQSPAGRAILVRNGYWAP